MTNAVIQVENLGKRYVLGRAQETRPYRTLRESLTEAARAAWQRRSVPTKAARQADEEFWALRDVSFEIKQGEVVGVIGRNGAGKSTLLKILSRITEPTTGRIVLAGRVASLLEVGTGFHPELTGRENIFLNGAILGMSRAEIKANFDEIVAFAEVEKFLDTPVKRYSSGMYVRLAFAVAAHLEPDILIVDEVLAVGDAEFQRKCLGKMEDISKRHGRAIVFVSHQMNVVQSLCSRCVLLVEGQIHATGKPAKLISDYLRTGVSVSEWINKSNEYVNPYFKPTRFALVDRDLTLLQADMPADNDVGVLIEGRVDTVDAALCVGFAVYTTEAALLYWSLHTDITREQWPEIRLGNNRMVCWLPRHMLNEGEYRIELQVSLHFRAWFCQPGISAPSVSLKLRGGLSPSPYWMSARPGILAPILPFKILPR